MIRKACPALTPKTTKPLPTNTLQAGAKKQTKAPAQKPDEFVKELAEEYASPSNQELIRNIKLNKDFNRIV